MRPSRHIARILLAALLLGGGPTARADDAAPARGADELFWVPTLEQALDMSRDTGRPIFLMGYSLVGDGSTYTKFSDNACRGVY